MRPFILSLLTLLSLSSFGQSAGGYNIACDSVWSRGHADDDIEASCLYVLTLSPAGREPETFKLSLK